MERLNLYLVLIVLLFSCVDKQAQNTDSQCVTNEKDVVLFEWKAQESGTNVSFRGLCVVDSEVAWTSGSQGMVARTIDGGNTWKADSIPKSSELQFRDIEAFDSLNALVLSAGNPAKIYKTTNGGKNWNQTYHNEQEGIFFDAMAFWDEKYGIAFSDPINGKLVIIRTQDAGNTWEQLPNSPLTLEGEAGFAASGTCLAVAGSSHVWIGTGGKVARIFHSVDKGNTWEIFDTPIRSGKSSQGIFSLAFWDEKRGIAVGGDYEDDKNTKANTALTYDGGKTWTLVSKNQPLGYRSCVALLDDSLCIAVGTSGSDISKDGGKTWTKLDTTGYHVVAVSRKEQAVWSSGADGKVAKLKK